MPLKNILVPVDFSECGDAALSYAVELARNVEGIVHTVHACEAVVSVNAYGFGEIQYDQIYTAARARLDETLSRLAGAVQSVQLGRRIVTMGDPLLAVIDAARELQPDLVIMGSHGRGALKRWLLGSVTERVLQEAGCTVLVVKAKLPH